MRKTIRPRLLVETIGDVAVISFAESGIGSEEAVRAIAEHLSNLVETEGSGKLLLNFQNVQSMSGRMLAVLLWIARRIERAGGSMKLCSITPHLQNHFEITRLYRYFEIYSEKSAALSAFALWQFRSWEPAAPFPAPEVLGGV
jgi:anti-anti-sigma factor